MLKKMKNKRVGEKPLVSVIIPTFNEEEDLGKCLNSIIKQDLKNRIEVLIVDDDSTDNTVKIAKSYQKRINLRILRNGTRDAEKGKKIGLMKAKGQFFMYFDADMEYADKNWVRVSTKPLIENKKIVGVLSRFKANKNQNSLTRCLSYDIFQRDPIFIAFTPNIFKTVIEKEGSCYLCKFETDSIPAQGSCLYRTEVLKKVFSKEPYLMDNDVPVKLVKKGYNLFAFCPQVGIYHYLLKNIVELFKKRMRGVQKTYIAHLEKREYKWINLENKRNMPLLALWIIYTNTLIAPIIYSIYKSFKYKDTACLYESLINSVSTNTLIYGFLKSKKGLNTLFKL